MTRPVEDGRCSLFPDVFQLQWPGTANTSRMTKWTFPWVEEKAELLLWGGLCTNHGNTCSDFACCFHQPCINQHMVVLWYVGRRWGVSTNFVWLQFELKPILLLFEHVFSAYVIILLAGVLLFMYQPFGSFPYKWISVAEACRYFQDAQMNSSLGLKKIRTCYSEEDAEPWQHLSRSRVLRCFHQQCINQHMVVLSMSSSRASTAAATTQTGPMLPLLGPCCRLQATTSGRRAPVSGPSSRAHNVWICKQCHLNLCTITSDRLFNIYPNVFLSLSWPLSLCLTISH